MRHRLSLPPPDHEQFMLLVDDAGERRRTHSYHVRFLDSVRRRCRTQAWLVNHIMLRIGLQEYTAADGETSLPEACPQAPAPHGAGGCDDGARSWLGRWWARAA